MAPVTLSSIRKALGVVSPHIHRTPLVYSNSFSGLLGSEVWLKAENLQKTGSFKVRGAFNTLISRKPLRVVAASMGNHAQGVAYAAGRQGITAKIVMPRTASLVKQEATKGYGAEVVLHGASFADALRYALSLEEYTFIHAFDDADIIAGQGTVGLELLEDLHDVDAVLVPVGGGGLIAGIAVAVKSISPKTAVIGVQTASAPSAYRSFHEKCLQEAPPQPTIADGIAVERIGRKTFELIGRYVDDVVTVSEESIARAVLLFLERKKLVVEGAGAVPLAALLEQGARFRGKRVVLIVSGGNIDFTLIDRIIHKSLVLSGRIGVLRVVADDIPGSLHRLTGSIADLGGNILHVVHDRLAEDVPIGKTFVIITLETRGQEHLRHIAATIHSAGFALAGEGPLR
ncbi:MAG: threonine ammonia-lyase [Thermodesulfovibrionales bacterium]